MSNGFLQNAQMLSFFAQVFYWLAMPILVAYAVIQYKRWVNYQLGTGASGKLNPAHKGAAAASEVSVDEFVE
jgi:hypothetical protein